MKISEINKFKKELERKLKGVIQKANAEGIDTDSIEFKYKFDKVKKELINNNDIELSQYEQAELLDEIEKNIREAKILIHTKTKKVPVDWKEIINKPEPFSQQDIIDLPFSQLAHKDTDHSELVKSIQDLSLDNLDIKGEVSTQKKTIESILNKEAEPPLSHDELLEVTPDQHHKEKHDLESHTESKLKKELGRLVGGGYVDDLHKHYVDQKGDTRVVDIAGITKNDADLLYLGITSAIPLTLPTIVGQGGKVILVKGTEDGLEFGTATSTDEKVKYDTGDPTAGYVADKIIAGTGISVAEGAGADENKLVITNSIIQANLIGSVIHGATADTARPTGYSTIQWIGSVEPTNAENNDTWITTA